jgi:hypothetical protein
VVEPRHWPLPVIVAIASALLSTTGAALALHIAPRDHVTDAGERSRLKTPERAAESFVAAYTRGDFEQAARFAAGSLARELRARARKKRLGASSPVVSERRLLIEESFFLTQGRIRLTGIATRDDPPPASQSADWRVSITLVKDAERFLVEELSWPRDATVDRP